MKNLPNKLTALLSPYPDYMPYHDAILNLLQRTKCRPYNYNPIIAQTHVILETEMDNQYAESYLNVLRVLLDLVIDLLNEEHAITQYYQRYQNQPSELDRLVYGITLLSWYDILEKEHRYMTL